MSIRRFERLEKWERSLDSFFALFVRVQEDAVLPRLNLVPVLQCLRTSTVVTSECDSHDGMNDKIAFGRRSGAFPYFIAPLLYYVNGALTNLNSLNLELYWLRSITQEGVHFGRVPSRMLVALGSRKISLNRTCLKCKFKQANIRCYAHGLTSEQQRKLFASCCPLER